MKYIIILLVLLLSSCVTYKPMPTNTPTNMPTNDNQKDLILTTRGHNEEVKKDPN